MLVSGRATVLGSRCQALHPWVLCPAGVPSPFIPGLSPQLGPMSCLPSAAGFTDPLLYLETTLGQLDWNLAPLGLLYCQEPLQAQQIPKQSTFQRPDNR